MNDPSTTVLIGGTSGIGLELARRAAARGGNVILSGRDAECARRIAAGVSPRARGIGVDLSQPAQLADRLADIDQVDHLVLAAIDRDRNTAADYDPDRAVALVTLKLVGYTEAIHVLSPRMARDGSIVLFGGAAKDRPYPGSTTVSTVNGGITGLVRTLAIELAPIRVNAVHPGLVGDSPYWKDKAPAFIAEVRSRTPTGVLPTMADVSDAVEFLMRNRSVNGINLNIDSGWLLL